jgi:hypothetical protein
MISQPVAADPGDREGRKVPTPDQLRDILMATDAAAVEDEPVLPPHTGWRC